jgi:hypothetical protein
MTLRRVWLPLAILMALVLACAYVAAQDWSAKARAPAGVEVELVLTIPVSGQAADITARAAAFLKDSEGTAVGSRYVSTVDGVKALLTPLQRTALADIMVSLHIKATEKLLSPQEKP